MGNYPQHLQEMINEDIPSAHFYDNTPEDLNELVLYEGTHMLIVTDNVPTDLSSEYKIMEGPEEVIREICDILNDVDRDKKPTLGDNLAGEFEGRNNPYFYSIKRVEEELYDGYEEVYGSEYRLNLKQKFEAEKYYIDYKGKSYPCNLSSFEARKIFVG